MTTSIISFSPHKTALTLSLVFAVSSLFFVVPMVVIFSLTALTHPGNSVFHAAFPIGFIVILPCLYFMMGYIVTGIAAWLYNKVAQWTGGIQIVVADTNDS